MIRPLVLIASILLPRPALAHTAAAQSAAPPNVAPAHGASTAETPTDPLPRRAGPIGVRLGAPTEGRLIIDAVLEGGPADRAGLAAGDSILSLGGSPVSGRESLSAAMRGLRGGQVVSVEISRGGATLAKQLQLDEAQRETVEGDPPRVTRPGSVQAAGSGSGVAVRASRVGSTVAALQT